MDKIGDYIPLIIIAVSLIFTFVRKAGKNAAKEAEKTMLPNGIPQKNAPKPQVTPRPQPQPQVKAQKTLETSPKKNVYNPVVVERSVSSIQANEITDERRFDFDFTDPEELKKGIIFAEIFNRKY